MICDAMPCVCNAKVKTTAIISIPKTAAVRGKVLSGRESAPSHLKSLTEDQLVFVSCLRVLAPILQESELEKYSSLLAVPPSLEERIAHWKARRRYELSE